MAEQMTLENYPWDSDEAQDWEADEAIAEADESAEDIGEAARRRKIPRARGVRGITVQTASGPRSLSFPQRLTTISETNRSSVNHELARRRLEERLERFEARSRALQKSDVAAAGVVTLALGGGLTLWGTVKASQQGFTFNGWANQDTTMAAALLSATQLATSTTKAAMGGYLRSPLHIAADVFAATQLAAFVFGNLYTSSTPLWARPPIVLDNKQALDKQLQNMKPNDIVVTRDKHQTWQIIADTTNNNNAYRLLVPE
jgi:hypothetical protein